MAVLENIRVKLGVFITVLIAIALLSFIIDPSTLQTAVSMFSSKNDVGSMNGKHITYMEYSRELEENTNLFQALSGQSSLNDQATDMVRQNTWQSFFQKLVFEPLTQSAGIRLGEEELYDMTQGNDISPILMNENIFAGEDGTFDRSRLVSFVQSISMPTEQNALAISYWDYLQKAIKSERINSKYGSLLAQSLITTPVELRRDMEENNRTADLKMVMIPVGFGRDSSLTVSDSEIKAYYESHKKEYQQVATRDIEYVAFPIEPSLADINLAEADMQKAYPEFATSTNLRLFLARNSDTPIDTRYYKAGELASFSAPLDSFAFKATEKDILPAYLENNVYRAARITGIKQLPDSVMVHHILIQASTKEEIDHLADSLMKVLKAHPDRFASLAEEFPYGQDPNRNPGELGWFTQDVNIPGMESVFEAPLNKPYTIETQYGTHIVKVTQRTKLHKKVQLAVLTKEAVAGKETYQTIFSQANTLASSSQNAATFNTVAQENGWQVVPSRGIIESARQIAGYNNMREVVRWIFEAKFNAVSEPFAIDNKFFFVATVTGIHEEGTATLQEKRTEIYGNILNQKKIDKLYQTVKEEMQGYDNLTAFAEGTNRTVTPLKGVAFAGVNQNDPAFVGAISAAKENTLCGPVKGSFGVYVFEVEQYNDGAYYSEEDALTRKNGLKSFQAQILSNVLVKKAKVEDHRAKFF